MATAGLVRQRVRYAGQGLGGLLFLFASLRILCITVVSIQKLVCGATMISLCLLKLHYSIYIYIEICQYIRLDCISSFFTFMYLHCSTGFFLSSFCFFNIIAT